MAKILVIDDDVSFRDNLRDLLESEGYSVIEASDGEEGVEKYRDQHPDLVIMDIIMPRKDGVEAILDLKIDFPNTRIIAISGGGRMGPSTYLELAEGFGADKIFKKPVGRDELLNAIKELLD
jgi:CheY-like chemotaxis protein